jgi:hypothetical protein
VARAVHEAVSLVQSVAPIAMLTVVGCVIPPSLQVDNQDAAINSPPAILSVTSDLQALPEPGPVLFDRGATAGNLSLSLIDTDLDDTLYVRIFVDYNLPDRLPPRAQCSVKPNMNPVRTVTCGLQSLCALGDLGVQRSMSIMVFDRAPVDSGDPPFQQMPPGGLSTGRFYFLKCQPPQT